MSGILSGKTASYVRLASSLPDLRKALDERMGELVFRPLSPDENRLESIGSCSWRNLLDGPIDRGYLDGDPDLWACGIRRDVRRAPASLVRAETARAVSDYLQTCGGKPSKQRIREIGGEVRHALAMQAMPVPQSGLLAISMASGFALWDGPGAATGWTATACMGDPVYKDIHWEFLTWLVWSGLHEVQKMIWPVGTASFLDPEGNGARYIGSKDLPELLDAWKGKAQLRRAKFKAIVGDLIADVELSAAAMKVNSISFPEEVCASRNIETRLKERVEFLLAFEVQLGSLFRDFAEHHKADDWPDEFRPLLQSDSDGQEAEE